MKTYNITINGVTYAVEVEEVGGVASAPVAAPVSQAVQEAAPVQEAPPAPAVCPACGADNAGGKFCEFCGTAL